MEHSNDDAIKVTARPPPEARVGLEEDESVLPSFYRVFFSRLLLLIRLIGWPSSSSEFSFLVFSVVSFRSLTEFRQTSATSCAVQSCSVFLVCKCGGRYTAIAPLNDMQMSLSRGPHPLAHLNAAVAVSSPVSFDVAASSSSSPASSLFREKLGNTVAPQSAPHPSAGY